MSKSAEKEAPDRPFAVPSTHWLAQALCGWHDAESGRAEGESFPCSACIAQAEYVAEHAPFGPLNEDGHDEHAPQLNGLLADCPGCVTSPAETDGVR